MTLVEPQRGQTLLHTLNNAVFVSPTLTHWVPILADVFVFSYPILLVVRYITGMVKNQTLVKSEALTIFSGAAYVTIINIVLQSFLHKDRPIFSGDASIHLILKDLPTASFPSDHAAVGMIMGLTVLTIGYQRKHQSIIILGLILVLCSIIMSVSRVAVGVHRPTDILAGWGVAVIVCMVMNIKTVQSWQDTYVNKPLITIQEWIFKKVGIKDE